MNLKLKFLFEFIKHSELLIKKLWFMHYKI